MPILSRDVKCTHTINQSMLADCEDLSYQTDSRILSYQETCLSIRSQKIQCELDFNAAVEIYSENTTASLEGKKSEIQPWPPYRQGENIFMTHF